MGRFTSTRTTEQWGDERLLEVEAILQRHLQIQFHLNPGSTGASAENGEGSAPHNQVYFRSSWDLGCNRQFDLALRYVDNVPAVNVPSYLVGDTRVAWRARENLALSVVAQSFFDNHHPEFTGFLVAGAGAQVSGGQVGDTVAVARDVPVSLSGQPSLSTTRRPVYGNQRGFVIRLSARSCLLSACRSTVRRKKLHAACAHRSKHPLSRTQIAEMTKVGVT
jgi:hypothetical protein